MEETYDDRIAVLDDDECWSFLKSHELGRLAFQLGGDVHIVPINYAVEGRTLLFRTAPGEKLLSIVLGTTVAFEVDDLDEDEARSVVVRGSARLLDEDEAHRAELVALRPWIGGERYDIVELRPDVLTGRAFRLDRPWLHMFPHEARSGPGDE